MNHFLKVKKPSAAEIEAKKLAEAKAKQELEDALMEDAEEIALLSKVVKSGNVEEFNWMYTESRGEKKGPVTKEVTNLQAILINPKWADHGFDPEMQEITAMTSPE